MFNHTIRNLNILFTNYRTILNCEIIRICFNLKFIHDNVKAVSVMIGTFLVFVETLISNHYQLFKLRYKQKGRYLEEIISQIFIHFDQIIEIYSKEYWL